MVQVLAAMQALFSRLIPARLGFCLVLTLLLWSTQACWAQEPPSPAPSVASTAPSPEDPAPAPPVLSPPSVPPVNATPPPAEVPLPTPSPSEAAPPARSAPSPVPRPPAPTPTSPLIMPSRLSLGQAALTALRYHPNLKIQEDLIEQAVASIAIASDPWYPTVTSRNSFTYSEAQSLAAGGQTVIRVGFTRNYSVGLSLTQTLLDFGRTRNNVNAAELLNTAAQEGWNGAYQDLMLAVATAFFGVLNAQQNVAIQQDVVRNDEVQLATAQGFFEAGTHAKIDVTRAESDLATARVSLINATNSEATARVQLGTAMGLNQAASNVSLIDISLVDPGWQEEQAVTIGTKNRPDFNAQTARTESARSTLKAAYAQYYPTISSSFSYAWSEDVFLPQPYNWSVGLSVTVPIYNEPLFGATVTSAAATVRQNEATQEQLTLQVRTDVTTAWLNFQAAREGTVAANVAKNFAEENYRLAAERYKVGVGTSVDVSVSQQALIQARSQAVTAYFNAQLALANLYHSTGTLGIDVLLGLAKNQAQ